MLKSTLKTFSDSSFKFIPMPSLVSCDILNSGVWELLRYFHRITLFDHQTTNSSLGLGFRYKPITLKIFHRLTIYKTFISTPICWNGQMGHFQKLKIHTQNSKSYKTLELWTLGSIHYKSYFKLPETYNTDVSIYLRSWKRVPSP